MSYKIHHDYAYQPKGLQSVPARVLLFAAFLILLLLSAIVLAFTSAGPIILGTELNGNGSVEYLCLGTGCESMTDFRWSDK